MDSAEDMDRLMSRLKGNITSMEETLELLISTALSEKARQLPPLERAKLYSHIVYAIDSLLFSYLRLNGVNAKEHPIFRELARIKQYFEKIKLVEEGPEQPKMQLDKSAANRMIKHGLANAGRAAAASADTATTQTGEAKASVKRESGEKSNTALTARNNVRRQKSKRKKK